LLYVESTSLSEIQTTLLTVIILVYLA